jgi:RNA polymerase sigma-70 factor (ECF subfamily)
MSDEMKLLHRAQALDEDALSEIHERYYTPIYRYIAFRISDTQTVEDLTSEVFLRLLRAIREKNAPQNTLRGWLYGVASRVVKEHYRSTKRMNLAPLEDEMMSKEDRLEEQIQNKLIWEKMQSLLEELSDDQQNVLAMRFGFGMRIREVAQALGKSEGSIKMLQVRAITALSHKLQPGGTGA